MYMVGLRGSNGKGGAECVQQQNGRRSPRRSAQEVINRLQNEGYQVNVDRVGSAPINQCVVTNVRNPQTVTELVRVFDGRDKNGDIDWDWVEVVTSQSISVSLNCTR